VRAQSPMDDVVFPKNKDDNIFKWQHNDDRVMVAVTCLWQGRHLGFGCHRLASWSKSGRCCMVLSLDVIGWVVVGVVGVQVLLVVDCSAGKVE